MNFGKFYGNFSKIWVILRIPSNIFVNQRIEDVIIEFLDTKHWEPGLKTLRQRGQKS